jgi:hypothetical protein
MKEKKILVFTFVFTLSLLFSCQQDDTLQVSPTTQQYTKEKNLQMEFAQILATALDDNPSLRSFLKQEALKQFNNDYDILYHMIKDSKVSTKETIHTLLTRYAGSEERLNRIEENLPLLTIYVPELPEFSAENWNPENQIPSVAIDVKENGDVFSYDAAGKRTTIPSGYIPAFPIVVVKQNERVVIAGANDDASGRSSDPAFYTNSKFSYRFADAVFDGINGKTQNHSARVTSEIDVANIDAYFSGVEWHRDYVYYGLTPTNPIGTFRHQYSEFIASIKFASSSALGIMSDQSGDPFPVYVKSASGSPSWIDGTYEFHVKVLINARNGTGNELTKIFTAKGSDLFSISYRRDTSFPYLYRVSSITPREYYPNIELIPWDLESYGMAWKFIFYEKDAVQTAVESRENTSTFGTNFGIDVTTGEKTKLGLKFGGSTSTSQKTTYSVTTHLDSDFLGEAILTFDQPIIISASMTTWPFRYTTREITTGLLSVSIEPKQVF